MELRKRATPAAVALVLALGAQPAIVASGGQDARERSHERAVRSRANSEASAARRKDDQGPRPVARQEQGAGVNDARPGPAPPRAVPGAKVTRGSAGPAVAGQGYRNPRSDNRAYGNRGADSRAYGEHRYDDRRGGNPRYDSHRYAYSNRGYGYRSYGAYPGVRFGLGISIFAGSPFSFRFGYGWAPWWAFRFTMRPGLAYGGMSFLLYPDEAEIWIDGQFVGVAREFGGEPLPVSPGWRRVELVARGYAPVAFDVRVMPGQVIPYRGNLVATY